MLGRAGRLYTIDPPWLRSSFGTVGAAGGSCSPCVALRRPVPALGGSVDITSDYVLRGVSQSSGKAAWQGDAHWDFPAGWSRRRVGLAGGARSLKATPGRSTATCNGTVRSSADLELGAVGDLLRLPERSSPVDYNYGELSLAAMLARPDPHRGQLDARHCRCIRTRTAWPQTARCWTLEASWHRDLPPIWSCRPALAITTPRASITPRTPTGTPPWGGNMVTGA